uniref:Uncharacterized protein n=1 Tax=Trichuris muris TaxID=70415 RepID=A0A5S6QA74_TRIMR
MPNTLDQVKRSMSTCGSMKAEQVYRDLKPPPHLGRLREQTTCTTLPSPNLNKQWRNDLLTSALRFRMRWMYTGFV